jgi:hypothetical protein
MAGIDERLRRDLHGTGRPAAPDPGALIDEVKRRRARRGVIRRLQTVALVVVVLAGTAGGFLMLQAQFGASKPAGEPTETPSDSPSASIGLPTGDQVAMVPGIAFSVCRGSAIEGRFLDQGSTHAYVFTKAIEGGCPALGEGTRILAVEASFQDPQGSSSMAIFEPLDCTASCYAWTNADIDGDGKDEIAVVTVQGPSTTLFQLFEVAATPGGWKVSPIVREDGTVALLSYGGSVMHLDGAFCNAGSFIVWRAEPNADLTRYRLHELPYRLDGDNEVSPGVFNTSRVLTALDPIDTLVDYDPQALPPQDAFQGCGGSAQGPTSSP